MLQARRRVLEAVQSPRLPAVIQGGRRMQTQRIFRRPMRNVGGSWEKSAQMESVQSTGPNSKPSEGIDDLIPRTRDKHMFQGARCTGKGHRHNRKRTSSGLRAAAQGVLSRFETSSRQAAPVTVSHRGERHGRHSVVYQISVGRLGGAASVGRPCGESGWRVGWHGGLSNRSSLHVIPAAEPKAEAVDRERDIGSGRGTLPCLLRLLA